MANYRAFFCAFIASRFNLGTPQKVTDAEGEVVWAATVNPFGDVVETVTDFEQNIRFPGQYHDRETGLYYNWHRYYSPELGRYITSDPIGLAGGMNTYAYVGGNPVGVVDPEGLFTTLQMCMNPANAPSCAAAGIITKEQAAVIAANVVASAAGSAAISQVTDRQAEYQRMKDQCDKKPRKTGDRCSDLSREIDHYKNCGNWYEHWDQKWQPGRHVEKIQNWANRVETLKSQYDRECAPKVCN